eukprot:TRINITY_DN333_c0_g1_i3.p1 TRINITY_DN333_c0_g1~~TRINITY_DN333_c0_g1_i3.p1  ORF type:complete len:389 (+),score=98.37 TRINITY_DN333_c0_g1_i3:82-1248(+)
MMSASTFLCPLLLALLHCSPTAAIIQKLPHELNVLQTNSKRRPVALIMMRAVDWTAYNWTGYMYEPAYETLRSAFETGPEEYEVRIPKPMTHAAGKNVEVEMIAEFDAQTEQLGRGDVIIFMGIVGQGTFAKHAPKLREKGLYTVFYNADPLEYCQMNADSVDEIWDFSHKNIRRCLSNGPKFGAAPTQRYVPLGALETVRVTYDADAEAAPATMNFFGHVSRGRVPCYKKLGAMIGEINLQLGVTKDVWDDESFKALLNKTDIFLNMNHDCDMNGTFKEDERQEVFWRVPKLINAHALVISEPCWPEDAAEFEGLVDFVPFNSIPQKFEELSALPAAERRRIADERAELFKKKFTPKDIFERASIYSLMDCLQDTSCDPKSVPTNAQ